MNLQVDLMLDTERRSGSSVSRKFVIRLTGITLPVIILGWFAYLLVIYQASKHDRSVIEQEKVQIDLNYKKVIGLKKDLQNDQALHKAIQAWGDSRLDAYRLLRGLQRVTPLTIQLTQLSFNEKVDAVETGYGRTASIYFKGKVGGQRPEADVQRFDQALRNEPPFPTIMAQVEVKRFAASEALNERGSRVFDIECLLKPRFLIQPSKPAPETK